MPVTNEQLKGWNDRLKAVSVEIDQWLGPEGHDVKQMQENAAKLIAARSISSQDELTAAEQKHGDPGAVVQAWRAIKRNNDMDPQSGGGPLGQIVFDGPGSSSPYMHDGTTNRQEFTRRLFGVRGGPTEVEIKTSKGWINCVTGEVNAELALQDGTIGTVQAG
jgi:hypothetical protein